MFVVTVDQKGSRSRGDAVPALLDAVAAWRSGQDVDPFVLPLQRTVGDEVQGVLADARAVVGLALLLQRLGGWSVGIGAGPVHEPLAETAPASAGEAFVLARTAVERARGRTGSVPLAVAGADAAGRRERAGWVGITAKGGRRRLDTALWYEEQRLHPLAARLLREAEAG